MSNESFFNYGDVVKLKRDSNYNDLKIDDYGIVWAVYASYVDESQSLLEFDYEGTFWNKKGNCHDEMFEEEDVEKVLEINEVPFTEEMREFWQFMNQKNKSILWQHSF